MVVDGDEEKPDGDSGITLYIKNNFIITVTTDFNKMLQTCARLNPSGIMYSGHNCVY